MVQRTWAPGEKDLATCADLFSHWQRYSVAAARLLLQKENSPQTSGAKLQY